MRRALRGLAAALVATAGVILLHVSPAHAAAPDRTGWWSVTQPSSGVVPNATAQPGELEIIGSPSGPAAFAAVHYTVPTDVGGAAVDTTQVTGTLTLAVAPNSSAQGASLQVCPTTSQWKPEEHGAMTDAPKYTCPATPVAGQVSPDNNTVTFKLESSLMTQPGAFDLAIVPNGQTPFFVKFAKPDERSLEVSAPAAPGPTSTDTGASSTSADTTALTPAIPPSAPVLTPTPSLSSPTGDVPLAAAPAPSGPPPPPTGGAPSLRLRPAHSTSGFTTERRQQLMSVGLLLGIAGALWWMGGAALRAPRLLGSLGGGRPDAVPATVRVGGVGRFARPRTAAPRPI